VNISGKDQANGVMNYDFSTVGENRLVNFGPLTE